MIGRWRDRYFEETIGGRRRLIALLYILVLPPFAAVLVYTGQGAYLAPQVIAVLILCIVGAAWVIGRKNPGPHDFIYPVGIAPIVCCGIAFYATGHTGPAFLGAMGAPIAWAAVLFEGPTVFSAWITGTLTCFTVTIASNPPVTAVANMVVFGVVQGLVALVVHGKSSGFRAERLRSLERHFNDIEFMLTPDGTVVETNDRAVEAYGYSRAELLSMNVRTLRANSALVTSQMKEVMERGALVFESEHVRRDGTVFPVEISSRVCTVGGKKYLHSLVRDITGRRLQQQALRDALAAEKRFLATMSHEIRTPLHGLTGFLELLASSHLVGEQRRWIDNAHMSARHLLTLLNDILDVSKLEVGQVELAHDPFDLEAVLEECLAITSGNLKPGVKLLHALPEAPRLLVGDTTRIRQIVLNVLSNAAKFTLRGHIDLNARIEPSTAEHVHVTIDIQDTGIGIPADKLEGLFKQFRQAHAGRRDGTGLGLFLSRSLARRMGGDVTVESVEGVGSRFRIVLELALGSFKSPSSHVSHTDDVSTHGHALGALRLLLVDDVPMNLLVARETLRVFFGIDVDTVGNGLEAIQKVQERSYDLVLMDVQMPVMDGIETTRRIRRLGLAIPIVALTAGTLRDELEMAMNAGMNGYLTKPLRRADLEPLLLAYASLSAPDAVRASRVPPSFRLSSTASPLPLLPRPTPAPEEPPVIDLKALQAVLGDDTLLFGQMLEIYRAERPATMEMLRASVAASDADALRRGAHRLKGQLSNLGAAAAVAAARGLENLGREGHLEHAPSVLKALEASLDRFDQEAAELLLRERRG